MDVVAVNRAVSISVPRPDADDTGNIRRIVPAIIARKKLAGIICTGANLIPF